MHSLTCVKAKENTYKNIVRNFIATDGIIHQRRCPNIHKQNGVSKTYIGTSVGEVEIFVVMPNYKRRGECGGCGDGSRGAW